MKAETRGSLSLQLLAPSRRKPRFAVQTLRRRFIILHLQKHPAHALRCRMRGQDGQSARCQAPVLGRVRGLSVVPLLNHCVGVRFIVTQIAQTIGDVEFICTCSQTFEGQAGRRICRYKIN